MGQISELKYGFYNSYKLDPNERFYATPFDVAYLSHITAQVVIIKPSGTIADGQINVDWYDADDVEVGSRSTHTITPTQLWSRKTATFEVPTGAVNAKLHFFGGEQGYNISCPMVEPGEIASAFSGEVASRLAYMSSEGGYFGLLNAGQIVAGKLIDPTEKAWFDLDKPEIVMKGTSADLYIDPSNPLRLVDKDNNFIGGVMNIGGEVKFVAKAITNIENATSYAEIGTKDNPNNPDVPLEGLQIYVKRSGVFVPLLFLGSDSEDSGAMASIQLSERETALSLFQVVPDYPVAILWAKNSTIRVERDSIALNVDYPYPSNDAVSISMDVYDNVTIYSPSGTLGIDSTGGPYAIRKNGTKIYL